jgi:hypothetical protein
MIFLKGFPEISAVEMGINFSCSDAFMSQHFLYARRSQHRLLLNVFAKEWRNSMGWNGFFIPAVDTSSFNKNRRSSVGLVRCHACSEIKCPHYLLGVTCTHLIAVYCDEF